MKYNFLCARFHFRLTHASCNWFWQENTSLGKTISEYCRCS